ncbi:hypothetical protein VOLCADRAFT_95121 [Volvox carteri f. nagariensis]|uniref:PABS domain-containing protein n=1 Tax=Volvox carteri f. nagariensis TaxID=3068 RepID=D8U6N3_VOLCA|nr:uncharacterized protein VOLCADRAFT_95121 [Volvox carteri f. nagariensis]EFJ44744.1 hypothetical protein VOLCADRAFT_95121 [Volvox carteri f. nagariensis]|eukprot:XP_002954320.1 hypothetical protein VOLCADRAFT_95121 [Volvox carteri f. nagariensis]
MHGTGRHTARRSIGHHGGAEALLCGRYAGNGQAILVALQGNIHSVYRPDRVLTSAYWDVLATLPSLVPPGPLGLLGLGAGTIPRIIGAHYPCRTLRDDDDGSSAATAAAAGEDGNDQNDRFVVHGWELDPGVVMASRLYLGMDELEINGVLITHTGDALSSTSSVPGGFTGVIVDLFAGGKLLPQLTKRVTWEGIRDRLMMTSADSVAGTSPSSPGLCPRVMANLGQAPPAVPGVRWQPEAYTTLRAYEAMEAAFDGEVSLLTVEDNTIALSGPLPSRQQWPRQLPPGLTHVAQQARGSWARDVYPLQTTALAATPLDRHDWFAFASWAGEWVGGHAHTHAFIHTNPKPGTGYYPYTRTRECPPVIPAPNGSSRSFRGHI